MSDSVRIELREGVAWIVLNRADALNSFNDEMGGAFIEALQQAEDPSVRSVVITGEGRAFCAGEDLRDLSEGYLGGRAPDLAEILRRRYHPAITTIVNLPKPVIAAINGVAAGAGVSLALACDYRIMAAEASLVLAFSKVGLVPDSGGTWFLPRYMGNGRAMEAALIGDAIPASKALEWGLVNRVEPHDKVTETVGQLAEQFASGPTLALGMIKKLIWDSAGRELSDQLEAEADAQGVVGASADHLEGVQAFLEKRPPKFRGA